MGAFNGIQSQVSFPPNFWLRPPNPNSSEGLRVKASAKTPKRSSLGQVSQTMSAMSGYIKNHTREASNAISKPRGNHRKWNVKIDVDSLWILVVFWCVWLAAVCVCVGNNWRMNVAAIYYAFVHQAPGRTIRLTPEDFCACQLGTTGGNLSMTVNRKQGSLTCWFGCLWTDMLRQPCTKFQLQPGV